MYTSLKLTKYVKYAVKEKSDDNSRQLGHRSRVCESIMRPTALSFQVMP